MEKMIDGLVPDIGSLPTIRRKRAPKHDFKDGKGRVFAHRHDNGGGWVADTAYVAPTVVVKRNAQVYDFARVVGNCRLESRARVCEHACLYDNAIVKDKAAVCGAAVLRNATVISGEAFISGAADLSGNTRVSGNVRVLNRAKLINTCCANNATYRQQVLEGFIVAVDSYIYEVCQLSSNVTLLNTTLRNVLISGTAYLAQTTVHTQLNFDAHQRLYTKDGAAQHNTSACVAQFHDVRMLNSRVIVPPMFIDGNNVIVDCEIALQPDDAPQNLFRPPNLHYYVRTVASRSSDLFGLSPTAMENIRNNRPANPSAIAQNSVSPILTAGAQRRILRLGDPA